MDAAAAHQPDVDVLTGLNNRFHRAILEASGNDRLCSLMSSIVQVPLVWRTFSHYTPEELRRSLAHHHELIDTLRAGDSEWAESVKRTRARSLDEHPTRSRERSLDIGNPSRLSDPTNRAPGRP